jgi:hypothetical protein
MASTTDVAEDLLTFAGGPSILGVSVLLGYARGVLDSSERNPGKGWRTLGAGVLLCAWMLAFLVLACPTVWRSWFADGPVQPKLALLTASWFAAIGLLGVCLVKARSVAEYLAESYHQDEGPWPVRFVRRILG